MSRLTDIAKKTVGSGGGLSAGREYINMDELIASHPDGISINGLEMATNPASGAMFPTFTFKEDNTRYFSGGKALSELADAWLSAYGDSVKLNRDLAREPVKIKLTKVSTKKGKTFVKVMVVDTQAESNIPF